LRQLAAFYEMRSSQPWLHWLYHRLYCLQSTRKAFPNLVYRVTAHDHSPCPKKKNTVWVTPPADLANSTTIATNATTAAGSDIGRTQAANSSSSESTPAAPGAAAKKAAEDTKAADNHGVVAVAAAPENSSSSSSSGSELAEELQEPAALSASAAGWAVSLQQTQAPKKRKSARFGGECVPAHKGMCTCTCTLQSIALVCACLPTA
jgi:hypothetical protein